jgi:acyl carrier protein
MEDVILEYVRNEYLDDDDDVELDANTRLISSGIVDSFSMVSLKRFVEKKYGISIPDAEATPEAFDTVTSIIAVVRKHLGRK